LYAELCAFFASLDLALPHTPPLLLVESSVLVQQAYGTGAGGPRHGELRGLTCTEERIVPSVLREEAGPAAGLGAAWWRAITSRSVQLRRVSSVSAILVLYGMPRLLTGSIIAHELMHAWLRLNGTLDLEARVEEGLCQLMSFLWLQMQQGAANSAAQDRLGAFIQALRRSPPRRRPPNQHARAPPRSMLGHSLTQSRSRCGRGEPQSWRRCGTDERGPGTSAVQSSCSARRNPNFDAAQHQIMHEPSEVYGEGFRRAYAAFMRSPGLTALLGFVRRSGQFPPVTPSPG
jgi:hypothetical protein